MFWTVFSQASDMCQEMRVLTCEKLTFPYKNITFMEFYLVFTKNHSQASETRVKTGSKNQATGGYVNPFVLKIIIISPHHHIKKKKTTHQVSTTNIILNIIIIIITPPIATLNKYRK